MHIAFIGSPASGKTTTAAMVFSRLKEEGYPVEFVPEYARLYIAQARSDSTIRNIDLQDFDQREIQETQMRWELAVSKSCGSKIIIVSESWSVSSLLYMKVLSPLVITKAQRAIMNTDLVFYCPPLKASRVVDPNRVHNRKQSLCIDKQIPKLLQQLGAPEPIALKGTPLLRASQVVTTIFSKL